MKASKIKLLVGEWHKVYTDGDRAVEFYVGMMIQTQEFVLLSKWEKEDKTTEEKVHILEDTIVLPKISIFICADTLILKLDSRDVQDLMVFKDGEFVPLNGLEIALPSDERIEQVGIFLACVQQVYRTLKSFEIDMKVSRIFDDYASLELRDIRQEFIYDSMGYNANRGKVEYIELIKDCGEIGVFKYKIYSSYGNSSVLAPLDKFKTSEHKERGLRVRECILFIGLEDIFIIEDNHRHYTFTEDDVDYTVVECTNMIENRKYLIEGAGKDSKNLYWSHYNHPASHSCIQRGYGCDKFFLYLIMDCIEEFKVLGGIDGVDYMLIQKDFSIEVGNNGTTQRFNSLLQRANRV